VGGFCPPVGFARSPAGQRDRLSIWLSGGMGNLPCPVVGATDAPAFQRTIQKLIIKDFDDEYNDDYGDVDIEI